MKRLIVFASFNDDNEVPSYVLYHLEALRHFTQKLIFVTNSAVSTQGQLALANFCDGLIERPNIGFDFAAWRDALRREDMADWDEVLLTNSSIIGPLFDLSPLFHEMQSRSCDFWGLTLNRDRRPHLQSYFLCFKRSVITSQAWTSFWSSVRDEKDKRAVILRYEIELMNYFVENGFSAEPYMAPIVKSGRDRVGYHWTNTMIPLYIPHDNNRINPTIYFPVELIQNGFPYLKTALVWGAEKRQCVSLEAIKQMKHVTCDWARIGL